MAKKQQVDKKILWQIVLVCIAAIVIAILIVILRRPINPPTQTTFPHVSPTWAQTTPYNQITVTPIPLSLLPASDYPVPYLNISWEQTKLDKNNVDRSGVSPVIVEMRLIQSNLVSNLTDTQINDYFKYYGSQLASKGWTRNNSLDSSGMGELLYWSKDNHYFGVGHVDYKSHGNPNAGERFIIEYN